MLSYNEGVVIRIIKEDKETTWVEVKIKEKIEKAVNYNGITGQVSLKDQVILNTTAVELGLGTGGQHFILFNYSNTERQFEKKGHIMKLRYTPLQIKCLAAEEKNSPYYDAIKNFETLEAAIVAVGTLHSMLAPIACMLKWLNPSLKITYIMTDGGALPIHFSDTVKELKSLDLLDHTITIGHAFGGEFECINIYTALILSKEVLHSDVTIVTMGPGIVGTGTKFGFSGIEQGYIIDAVNNLEGTCFPIPRISFKDKRERHYGISHHTLTNLKNIACTRGTLILPLLETNKMKRLHEQIEKNEIESKHHVTYENGLEIMDAIESYKLKVTTMGRDIYNDKDYFIALGAVGRKIAEYIEYH